MNTEPTQNTETTISTMMTNNVQRDLEERVNPTTSVEGLARLATEMKDDSNLLEPMTYSEMREMWG